MPPITSRQGLGNLRENCDAPADERAPHFARGITGTPRTLSVLCTPALHFTSPQKKQIHSVCAKLPADEGVRVPSEYVLLVQFMHYLFNANATLTAQPTIDR